MQPLRHPAQAEVERFWSIGRQNPIQPWPREVFPRGLGVFLRHAGAGSEIVAGQCGLIPWFSKSPELKYSTNNARGEELAARATFKEPWAKGQRCIIPATSFDEPCWETGKNIWWRFRPAEGGPWGLAGLWNAWVDPASGEIHESYTMLTINADQHPLMRRMHRPNPRRPADRQDKRSVIPIAPENSQRRLTGSVADAESLLPLPGEDAFQAEAL